MNIGSVGFNLTFSKLWHRALASYLRAVAAIVAALVILPGVAVDWANFGWSLLAAAVAPLAQLLTESAELVDPKE